MKVSGLITVLSTLLPLVDFAASGAVPVAKRMDKQIFGKDGTGARYWAWARVAYDSDYNSNEFPERLGDGKGKDWSLLAGGDIMVQGVSGKPEGDGGRFFGNAETHMNAVIGLDHDKKAIIVGFKGTDDMSLIVMDLKYSNVDMFPLDGLVEKGFSQCMRAVQQKLFDWAAEYTEKYGDYDLVFVGHSLGGAAALIGAASFTSLYSDVIGRTYVFTYGSPRAGDKTFQKSLEDRLGDRMFNFRHQHDPISMVPMIHNLGHSYANPAGRYLFKPTSKHDTWFDESKWEYIAGTDKERRGLTGIVDGARDVIQRLRHHKEYFNEGEVPTKRDLYVDFGNRHQKRKAPAVEDIRRAEDLLERMKQNSELIDPPTEPTDNLKQFAKALNVSDDVYKLLGGIQEQADEHERRTFLSIAIVFAAEQK